MGCALVFVAFILTPLKSFSTMDLDNDYYSSKCKYINSFLLFKRIFMTFVGGDGDH
jgi:hypothetical protein